MDMLPGERVVHETPRKDLVVTSHRLLYSKKGNLTGSFAMVWLKDVSGIEWGRRAKGLYLWVAAGVFVGAFFLGLSLSMVGIILGLALFIDSILVALHFGLRFSGIRIRAGSAIIDVPGVSGGRLAAESLADLILGLRRDATASDPAPARPSFIGWQKKAEPSKGVDPWTAKG